MYDVYKWVGQECKYAGSTKHFDRAEASARDYSLEDDVSEVLIYGDGVLIEAWVNGNAIDGKTYMEEDLAWDFEDDYEEPWDDEIGYNPYIGCIDEDY